MPHFAILKALSFVAAMVAASACGVDNAIARHEPCWTNDDAFTYEPMFLEGVIQVDTTPNLEHLFLIEPNGRLADLGWPDGFTESFGPGRSGRAQSQFGLVVAQSGQRAVLWGALIRAATSKRAPASPGHDGFVVCEIDGQRFTPPPDPRVDGSNIPNHVTSGVLN